VILARLTTKVWLGSSYVNKVRQFIQPGTKLNYAYESIDKVTVTMILRVYDVAEAGIAGFRATASLPSERPTDATTRPKR
jgi:hypothetical protein